MWLLGPLHKRAKSHDHESVRAQKKRMINDHPKTASILVWRGHGSSSIVRSHMWPGSQSTATSMIFLLTRIVTHDKVEETNGCERSECHGLPILCQTYLQHVVFENSPSDLETWFIRCHVGINSCGLYIHIAFTNIYRWSVKRSAK